MQRFAAFRCRHRKVRRGPRRLSFSVFPPPPGHVVRCTQGSPRASLGRPTVTPHSCRKETGKETPLRSSSSLFSLGARYLSLSPLGARAMHSLRCAPLSLTFLFSASASSARVSAASTLAVSWLTFSLMRSCTSRER